MKQPREINNTVRPGCNANAQLWDEYLGEKGNAWYRLLMDPANLRLLDLEWGRSGSGRGMRRWNWFLISVRQNR
ncbi:MAG: hypothetical protein VYA69_07055 [Gemmatimonadota bacterium]|nr:hypothetical protein [Gemmatimonadota bacterium]